MASLNEGYLRGCKDGSGGVKSFWLFPWVKYSRKVIERNGIELTAFPNNTIYKFEGNFSSSFTDAASFDKNGEKFDQTLNVTFTKMANTFYFENVREQLLRAVVLDNNGNYWLLGQDNGLRATQYQKGTGSSKGELNGYTLALSGSERLEAPYMSSIDILTGTGAKFDSTLITFDNTLITFDSL